VGLLASYFCNNEPNLNTASACDEHQELACWKRSGVEEAWRGFTQIVGNFGDRI
jgi:hypothetical protein